VAQNKFLYFETDAKIPSTQLLASGREILRYELTARTSRKGMCISNPFDSGKLWSRLAVAAHANRICRSLSYTASLRLVTVTENVHAFLCPSILSLDNRPISKIHH
jgi:hypothetical protein